MASLGEMMEPSMPRRPMSRHIDLATPPMPSARRVLVADPCADTVESTAWLLRLWGYDARTVRTGHEVLQTARVYRPDAILMEIALPGLCGCEVARRLWQQNGRAGMLLVAITGYGDTRYRRRSREVGFDYHFLKPVDPDVLRHLLATTQQGRGG